MAKKAKTQDLNLNDLKASAQGKNENATQFNNVEWLEKTDPTPYHTEENVSSKYDSDREREIIEGLKEIVDLGIEINPLMILLAKWWEVKPARAEIKKLIDAEAEAKGMDKVTYLQDEIGAQVQKLSNIGEAISRLKYAKTYFKPRGDYKAKLPKKQLSIDGKMYQINVADFNRLKDEHGDKKALKKAILAIATPVEIEEL